MELLTLLCSRRVAYEEFLVIMARDKKISERRSLVSYAIKWYIYIDHFFYRVMYIAILGLHCPYIRVSYRVFLF